MTEDAYQYDQLKAYDEEQAHLVSESAKADESRLLRDEEIEEAVGIRIPKHSKGFMEALAFEMSLSQLRRLRKAQDAKTASIKDTECQEAKNELTFELGKVARDACQQRVERILGKVEAQFATRNEVDIVDKKVKPHYLMRITVDRWQALKKQEGIK